jgi:hypothetical protein
MVAARQVGTANRSLEYDVADKCGTSLRAIEQYMTRRMAGHVAHFQLDAGQRERAACLQFVRWRRRRFDPHAELRALHGYVVIKQARLRM